MPSLAKANKVFFPQKPAELNLHQLEERLIALRIPFMQIRELPRGGQLSIHGNVVNVPVDIQPTIKALPRTFEETTVAVKLKRKLAYKKVEVTENVRPNHVLAALHWLLTNSELYKNSGVAFDEAWCAEMEKGASSIVTNFMNDCELENVNEDEQSDDSDGFSEIDASERIIGNSDTLIDPICPQSDSTYTFAPGEGQIPLGLYKDPNAEELSFPTIYCGQARTKNTEREVKVHYSDLAKWELRHVDRRAANSVPNIFFKMKKIQAKQISDKVNLSIRRCKRKENNITAADALNTSQMNKLVNLDEGFYIFRTLRNSPPYLEKRKKDVFAMIRQLGLPTWFGSLSAGDTRWHDLLRILGELNDGVTYTAEQLQNMTWQDKTRLVQQDPVTCARHFDNRVLQFINIVLKSDHAPLGELDDYFYRVEFQHRGSPHIHMLMWIKNSPKYKSSSESEIVQFVEKYISCSGNVSDHLKPLVDIQTHKHSKTCRKKGKAECRFGFPLPPLPKTLILEPLDEDHEHLKKKYAEVQTKLNELKDVANMSFEEFLNEISMTQEQYILCIRSSLKAPKVFLKRKVCEARINPYMLPLLETWDANHDLQYVLDPYACAVYIVAYISKSQRGMSILLDEACKEARKGNMDIKRQVRHMGNKFLNSVEVSAQEAAYLVLQLPLTKASRDVVFINTSESSERTFLLKQKDSLEQLPPDSTDIEADNVVKRYSKRPKQLQNMCLADYVSKLDIKYPKKKHIDDEVNDDEDVPLTDSDDEINNATENCVRMELRNGIIIKQRKNRKVIRYVRYNVKTDSENHYREKLLLFFPWRNEKLDLLGGHDTYEDHYNHVKKTVDLKCSEYEHHVQELDDALQRAEDDLSEQFDKLAPQTQHSNEEDKESETTNSNKFIYYKPQAAVHEQYDIGIDLGVPLAVGLPEQTSTFLSNNEFLDLVRKLNREQREFFNHVLHWVKTKDEPLYAFLTGVAGVGKSVVIKALEQALRRYLCSEEGENPENCRVLLCAPTGKAAHNINGTTIHAAFKILPNRSFDSYTVDSDTLNTLRVKYRNLSPH
ncbi:uncharacterized protein LOC117328415 [Pecten maximus]|uniref:uncharacterized protein LOC117328415 n=1 Tax=Pecten maximus TaxID=6579 RepID=UPI001458C375|nr:uncharacterized protein LOC117328415 [Pecten maximus]